MCEKIIENYTNLKSAHFILFTLLMPTFLFAQNIKDSLLATCYNKTLTLYFSDTSFFKNQAKFGHVLIISDIDTNNLTKFVATRKFKFFKNNSLDSILDKPLKKNIGRNIFWITHKLYGKDTIDVIIDVGTVYEVKHHNVYIASWCRGTNGYNPNGRFIYDKKSNLWMTEQEKEIYYQIPKNIKKE